MSRHDTLRIAAGWIAAGRIAAGALALIVAAPASTPAFAQEVGKASAVNPAATANLRTITIGSSITHKERIKTAAEGSVQILFVDKTSMTIGPNSDLTIDEYVYNPNAGTGKLAATLGKGALRFVGGQISHTGDAEIKTATAVIGIRGGVALITPLSIFAGYGSSTVTSGGSTVTLGAGEFTRVMGGGQPPLPPGPPPQGFVAGLIQSFQSAGGQSGGAPRGTATPATIARAETRATGTNGGAVAGQLTPPPIITQVAPLITANTNGNLTQTVQTTVQTTIAEQTVDSTPAQLSGYFGGIMGSSRHQHTGVSLLLGAAEVIFGGGQRVQANLVGGTSADADYAPDWVGFQYGSVDPNQQSNSQVVDGKKFSAQVAIGRDGKPLSTIDGQPLTSHSGELRTVSAAEAREYAWARGYDLTVCACDYTRWGTWSSESRQNVDGSVYMDAASGFWVAGQSIKPSDVPTVGTASYAGHVVANIRNGDNSYISAGNLTATVNFGSRTGTAQVANFDGVNYAGSIYINPSDPRLLAAGLYGATAGRSMALSGEFLKGSTSPVGEMGGAALVSGSNYLGTGIFAARMK